MKDTSVQLQEEMYLYQTLSLLFLPEEQTVGMFFFGCLWDIKVMGEIQVKNRFS